MPVKRVHRASLAFELLALMDRTIAAPHFRHVGNGGLSEWRRLAHQDDRTMCNRPGQAPGGSDAR